MGREVTGVSLVQNTPQAMVESQASADSVQEVKRESLEGNNEDQNSSSPVQHTSETAAVENTKIKSTPQKPSKETVDEQECDSLVEVETPVSPTASNSKSASSEKKSEPNTPPGGGKNLDDEDSWSMASSGASGRTIRSKTTVGVAPTFTCNERLEKRKEYYAKLEEKRKALEAEKREYEARTKEEEEATIKQLRKNMVFRANPVPNFYYEKPPPKKEPKKVPTTRAVSPKLGRRKSCGDISSSEEMGCSRGWRHSLGSSHKEGGSTTSKQHNKDHHRSGASSNSKATKDRSKQVKESTKNTPPKIEQTNADIAVQS